MNKVVFEISCGRAMFHPNVCTQFNTLCLYLEATLKLGYGSTKVKKKPLKLISSTHIHSHAKLAPHLAFLNMPMNKMLSQIHILVYPAFHILGISHGFMFLLGIDVFLIYKKFPINFKLLV